MSDLISRQAAIDALWKALYEYEDKTEKQFQEAGELAVFDWFQHRIFVQNMSDIDRRTLLDLPSAEPRWISVTDRLPEHEYGESTCVLTVDLYRAMRVLYFDGGNWCWPSGEALTTMRVAPITHWMPLPEPPKEETK